MIKIIDEQVTSKALLPILSIKIPRNGLRIAEMMYGTPNILPAVVDSTPYFF